jgi:hypothetical protein
MKKMISLALAVLMLMGILAVPATAEETQEKKAVYCPTWPCQMK